MIKLWVQGYGAGLPTNSLKHSQMRTSHYRIFAGFYWFRKGQCYNYTQLVLHMIPCMQTHPFLPQIDSQLSACQTVQWLPASASEWPQDATNPQVLKIGTKWYTIVQKCTNESNDTKMYKQNQTKAT